MDDAHLKWARERLKELNPAADVVAMVRSREAGNEDLHGDLISPYLDGPALMLVLHLYTETFARVLLGELRKRTDMDVDAWLEQFVLTIASEGGLPPDPLGSTE